MIELLKNRRSIRVYKDNKVKKEDLDKILKAALLTPSGRNFKPVEFIVVEDKEAILKLSKCKSAGTLGLETSPLAIIVIADKVKSSTWVEDAAIATMVIQEEVESLGLGSCWIQMKGRQCDNGDSEETIRKAFNIPDNFGVLSVLSIGYKDEQPEAHREEDLDFSKVHYGTF